MIMTTKTTKKDKLRDKQLLFKASIIEEIAKEKQKLGATFQALEDTRTSISEVEQKIIKSDNGNDKRAARWRKRYLSQVRVNEQLENEKNKLKDEVESERAKIINGWSHYPYFYDLEDEMSEPEWLRLLRQLEMVKNNLYGELRNAQWRLDQQSKAFHHLNDLCSVYRLEISVARTNTVKIKQMKTYEDELKATSNLKLPSIPLPPITTAEKGHIRQLKQTDTLKQDILLEAPKQLEISETMNKV